MDRPPPLPSYARRPPHKQQVAFIVVAGFVLTAMLQAVIAAAWLKHTEVAAGLTVGLAFAACLFGLRLLVPFPSLFAGIVGPLCRYDLTAQARRGQQTLLRSLAGGVMLVALFLLYAGTFKGLDLLSDPFAAPPNLGLNEVAKFATYFATLTLAMQFALVVVLTPTLVADAIARDKERGALDFLLVTDLTDLEIVFGRLVGRTLHVGNLVVALLPVLALTQLFGGVAIELLVAGTLFNLGTLVGIGGLCVLVSTFEVTVLRAVVRSYACALPYLYALGFGFSAVIATGEENWPVGLAILAAGQAAVGVGAGAVAATQLRFRWQVEQRAKARPSIFVPEPDLPGAAPTGDVLSALTATRHHRPAPPPLPVVLRPPRRSEEWPVPTRPPVSDNPLLWKERYLHALFRGGQIDAKLVRPALGWLAVLAIAVAALFHLLGLLTFHNEDTTALRNGFASMTAVGVIVWAGTLMLHAIAHAANSICRERERDTLSGLLTLPDGPWAVLYAKWWGSFAAAPVPVGFLAATLLAGTLGSGLHPAALAVVLLLLLAAFAFAAAVGLVISMACKTSLQANLLVVAVGLSASFGPVVALNILEAVPTYGWYAQRPDVREFAYILGIPPVAWFTACRSWSGLNDLTLIQRSALLAHFALYGGLACLAWRTAQRQFGRVASRPAEPPKAVAL